MMNETLGRPIDILLVEDNPADVRLTVEALRDAKIRNRLHVARDGIEALSFLQSEGQFADAPLPDLILLDLNLPKKDGREVLDEIKRHPVWRRIPVVILTTSRAEEDILRSYELHANCYISKPVELDGFLRIVRSIEEFWLEIVELPNSMRDRGVVKTV